MADNPKYQPEATSISARTLQSIVEPINLVCIKCGRTPEEHLNDQSEEGAAPSEKGSPILRALYGLVVQFPWKKD